MCRYNVGQEESISNLQGTQTTKDGHLHLWYWNTLLIHKHKKGKRVKKERETRWKQETLLKNDKGEKKRLPTER